MGKHLVDKKKLQPVWVRLLLLMRIMFKSMLLMLRMYKCMILVLLVRCLISYDISFIHLYNVLCVPGRPATTTAQPIRKAKAGPAPSSLT